MKRPAVARIVSCRPIYPSPLASTTAYHEMPVGCDLPTASYLSMRPTAPLTRARKPTAPCHPGDPVASRATAQTGEGAAMACLLLRQTQGV